MAFPQIRASIPQAASDTNSGSVVCTHPTGLAEGDLMVLFVAIWNPGADRGITTPSGWTLQDYYIGGGNRIALHAFKKIATAGDVSAGDTDVSFTGSVDKYAYGMFAVTGAASGSEITLSENDSITPSGSTLTATTAITPLVSESLALSAWITTDFSLSSAVTAIGFSLTPSETMTERVDVGVRDGFSDGMSLMIASAEVEGTTEITSRSATLSASISGESGSVFLLVNAPQNATASNALFQTTPETFSPLTGSTQSATNDFQDVEPQFFSQSATPTGQSVWTTIDKS